MTTMRTAVLLAALAGVAVPALAADAPRTGDRRSSVVQRGPQTPDRRDVPRGGFPRQAVYPFEFRTIDGWGNNPDFPWRGAAGEAMVRVGPLAYDDGIGDLPARSDGPSPRAVSNAVVAQGGSIPNAVGASDYLWQWGQFIDHDIVETPIASPAEEMDISVPMGDIYFDPGSTGTATMGFDRSAYSMDSGVREQVNNITAYLDASMVYGSDLSRALELRTRDGTGRLAMSPGDLLPFNVNAFHNAPTDHDPSFFLAGDIRANEQAALTAMHTLFVREHNHWADVIRTREPALSGNEVYERARAIVAAEIQAITYNEWLPLLLGPGAIPPYTGYDPAVDAGMANEFATAAFRVGHTMLSPTLRRVDETGEMIAAGHLALADAFFVPHETVDHGIDPILRGLSVQRAQEIDAHIVDDVRNFLFGAPGAGGFDLASLNIQRGRDHGVCSYNEVRVAYGMPAAVTFADITPDAATQAALASVYNSPEKIDPWVGLLAEPHAPGAMVGPTLVAVLGEQFTRMRDGDRFWYQTYLPASLQTVVEQQTLAVIIRRNTGIGDELPDNAFMVAGCGADLTGDGVLDLADIQGFIAAFLAGDAAADMDMDGVFDLADVQSFIALFNAGCP